MVSLHRIVSRQLGDATCLPDNLADLRERVQLSQSEKVVSSHEFQLSFDDISVPVNWEFSCWEMIHSH